MMNFWLAQAKAPEVPLQPLPHPEIREVFLPPVPMSIWIYVVGAFVLTALLALVLWLLLRPGAVLSPPLKKPWQRAMNELKEISNKAASQSPGETSAQVSEVLRRYFMDRYQIPAPFRTTHEIFHSAASQRLHKYASLADLWDHLSFAPLPVTPTESASLVEKAIACLEEDRP